MTVLQTFEIDSWRGPFGDGLRQTAIDALEHGAVLYFPKLPFGLVGDETRLLTPSLSNGRSKNISLDPSGGLKHAASSPQEFVQLQAMMQRFAESAVALVDGLFPAYGAERARTSYRPVEIAGRHYSALKDDTRLHVDAFPTRPMRGRRILRLFSNINPDGLPRVWNVGEGFEEMANALLPRVREPLAVQDWLLGALGVTRGRRSPYDNLMLGLHDNAKLDMTYQHGTTKTEIAFPPGSTWLCFTDQVMHAAMSGQFVLEQTFHVDATAMAEPATTPIRVLERLTGRALA